MRVYRPYIPIRLLRPEREGQRKGGWGRGAGAGEAGAEGPEQGVLLQGKREGKGGRTRAIGPVTT